MYEMGTGRIAGIVGAAIAVSYVWLLDGGQNDFVYDWLATKAFVSGVDPYQPLTDLAHQFGLVGGGSPEWIAPRVPGALLIQTPIGWVPFEHSYLTGRLLTVASAFFLAWMAAKTLNRPTGPFIAVLPVVLLMWPFSQVLLVSQTAFLLAGLVLATWYLGDKWYAGLPLAVAVLLKLWPWVLVPALWFSGRRKAAYGAAATFVVLNLAGFAAPNITVTGVARMYENISELSSWTITYLTGAPSWAVALLALALVAWVSMKSDGTYMWSVAVGLLAAPIVWGHYLPVLLAPLVLHISDRQVSLVDPEVREGVDGLVGVEVVMP